MFLRRLVTSGLIAASLLISVSSAYAHEGKPFPIRFSSESSNDSNILTIRCDGAEERYNHAFVLGKNGRVRVIVEMWSDGIFRYKLLNSVGVELNVVKIDTETRENMHSYAETIIKSQELKKSCPVDVKVDRRSGLIVGMHSVCDILD